MHYPKKRCPIMMSWTYKAKEKTIEVRARCRQKRLKRYNGRCLAHKER